MLELFVPILKTIASEAASLGLEVNWQKTKVQALGCREDMPLTIKVQGNDVMVVEEFNVYLGSLIHTTGSTCDISRRSAITRAAMQSLENQIWRSRSHGSLPQRSWSCTTRASYQYSCACVGVRWGRQIIIKKLSLCYSFVYCYNGAERYEQFLQVGWPEAYAGGVFGVSEHPPQLRSRIFLSLHVCCVCW